MTDINITDYKNIISTYNARKYLLEILETRGFNIDDYNNYTFNELSIQYENKQLDLLLESSNKKLYVKFYVYKSLKAQNIYEIVEDLFHLENILTKNDDLIIIIKDEPNMTIQQIVKDIYMSDGIYISVLNIARLQFNILKHEMVPRHVILSKEEALEVKKYYNIMNDSEIPDISYFSPVSLVLGIRPGNLVKIERKSRTAIDGVFYRICKL